MGDGSPNRWHFGQFWFEVVQRAAIAALFVVFAATTFVVIGSQNVHAAQTVPYKVNFQGRLTDSTGVVLADGNYNMTFRIFSVASGGTAAWSEVRSVSTQQVALSNGLFNVQLGDVTALSPSVFTSYPLYVEVELPTPATATCSTAGCAVYTEGAMTPRQAIASSPYAMNADTLDGNDLTSFSLVGQNNTYTANNIFKTSTNSSSAFAVQKSDGTSLLSVDTSGGTIAAGTGVAQLVGYTGTGSTIDSSESGSYVMSRFTTPSSAGSIAQASLNIGGSVDSAPNNNYEVGIYSDNAGAPGTLLATSTQGTLSSSGWTSTPISGATLSPSTNYWIAYMSNGLIATANNNIVYNSGGTSCAGTVAYATGFPTSAPACTSGTKQFSMYVTFSPTTSPLTVTTGKVGIGTPTPQASLEVDGTSLFRPISESSTAFMIQNSTSNPMFIVDTNNARVQIGSATPSGSPVTFVLSVKNTTGDPVGTAGAMYYNNVLNKFRCYENGAWTNCITQNNQTIVTLGSDVINNNLIANTISDVTGLSFPVTAGQTYHFSTLVNYTTAASNTPSLWTIAGPAASTISYSSHYAQSTSSEIVNYESAYNLPSTAAAATSGTNNIATVTGIVTPTSNGTLTVRFASGVANSAVTAKAGSTLTWW